MHWWGEGGGLRVLRAEPHQLVSDVVGAGPAATNGQTGKTVGQMLDWSAARLGSPAGPQSPNLSEVDLAGAMDRILELPPEARTQAMQMLNGLISAQGTVQRDEQEAAQKELYEGWLSGAVDPNDVPVELRQRVGQAGFTAFQSAVNNQLRGVQNTEEHVRTNLLDLAAFRPQAFIGTDLEYLRGNGLSDQDYRQLSDLQRDTRLSIEQGAAATQRMTENAEVFTAFNNVAPLYESILGYDPREPAPRQREQVVEFRRGLQSMVQDYVVENGAQPGQAALQDMAFELLADTTLGGQGAFGGDVTVPRFDVNRVREPGADVSVPRTEHEDIPADMRDALDTMVASLYGTTLTPGQRRARTELLFQIAQFTSGSEATRGLVPDVDLEDIVEDPLVAGSVEVLPSNTGGPLSTNGAAPGQRTRYRVDDGAGGTVTLSEAELRRWYVDFMRNELRQEGLTR